MNRILIQYIVFIWVVLLSGCATTPSSQDTSNSAVKQQATSTEQAEAEVKPVRPQGELSANVLYGMLVGELAGQQQRYDIAVGHYVIAALSANDYEVAKRATQIAMYVGYYEEALIAARRWSRLNPEDISSTKTMAIIQMRLGKVGRATRTFQHLIEDNEIPPAQGMLSIALLLTKEKDKQTALAVTQRLAAIYPELAESWYSVAQVAAQAGDFPLAIQSAEKALSIHENWLGVEVFYAGLLLRDGKEEQGIKLLQSLAKAHAKNSVVGLAYARALLKINDLPAAMLEYQRLEKQTPNDDVLFALALLYMDDNQLALAKDHLKKVRNSVSYSNEARYYLGRIAMRENDLETALAWFREVKEGKYSWDAQMSAISVIVDMGDIEKALQIIDYLRSQNPQLKQDLDLKEGEVLFYSKKYQHAYDFYTNILQSAEDRVDFLYGRSLAAEKLDLLDVAESDLKEILTNDPENTHALNALGYTLADRTDRHLEALTYIKKAYQLAPNDPAILDSMGWVKYRLGEFADAKKYLSKAYAISQDSEIASHLGLALWALGEHKEAYNIWDTALRENPADNKLHELIQRHKK